MKHPPAIHVVVDTNVYISAILFGGKPEEIRHLAREGRIEILGSEHILAEIADVLKKKFNWSDWQILHAIEDIKETATLITPKEAVSIIRGSKSDNRILECASEGKADYIISGDTKHLQSLKKFRNIPILSPSEFIRTVHT